MCDEFLVGCTLLTAFVHFMHAVFWHTCTFSGYINRLCVEYTVESDCVS